MPKVLIVDDYAIIRAGLIEAFKHIPNIEFEEAAAVIRNLRRC